jgi:hypothetical protein
MAWWCFWGLELIWRSSPSLTAADVGASLLTCRFMVMVAGGLVGAGAGCWAAEGVLGAWVKDPTWSCGVISHGGG